MIRHTSFLWNVKADSFKTRYFRTQNRLANASSFTLAHPIRTTSLSLIELFERIGDAPMPEYDVAYDDPDVEGEKYLYPFEANVLELLYMLIGSVSLRIGAWGAGRDGVRDVAVT